MFDSIGAFPLPIEVLPYGYTQVIRKLKEYSFHPVIRMKDGNIFITDNGNYIVDSHIGNPMDINDVYNKVNGITGVLEIGLFINMCNRIIVDTDSSTKVIENK